MTGDARFEMDLVAWLGDDARSSVPAHLHPTAMTRVGRARQRPGWLVRLRGDGLGTAGTGTRPSLRAVYIVAMVALLLAAVFAAFAVGARLFDPLPPTGENGAITYTIRDAGPRVDGAYIRTVEADGARDRQIVPTTCPSFSADGTSFAYLSEEDDRSDSRRDYEVYVTSADGTGDRPLTTVTSEPALSPDGTLIAWFVGSDPAVDEGGSGLWVAPTDGSPGQVILAAASEEPPYDVNESYIQPVWSPDGRSIAFAVMRAVENLSNSGSYRSAIFLVDADGSDLRLLTRRRGTDFVDMAWSPDGRHIAYLALPDGGPTPSLDSGDGPPVSWYPPVDVFVIGADGTNERNVSNTPADERAPSWSPDGARLAYTAFDGSVGQRLAVLPMDRGAPTGPPANGPLVDEFAWSPDARSLVWVRNRAVAPAPPSRTALQTIDRDFREPAVPLLELDGVVDCLHWSHADEPHP